MWHFFSPFYFPSSMSVFLFHPPILSHSVLSLSFSLAIYPFISPSLSLSPLFHLLYLVFFLSRLDKSTSSHTWWRHSYHRCWIILHFRLVCFGTNYSITLTPREFFLIATLIHTWWTCRIWVCLTLGWPIGSFSTARWPNWGNWASSIYLGLTLMMKVSYRMSCDNRMNGNNVSLLSC